MKRFTVFLVLVTAAIIATDRSVAFVLDQLYKQTQMGQTGGKINQYLNTSKKFDFLIFGNSRALYQVIPDSIAGHGFNLSHAGMGPAFQTGLISILEQEKKIPRKIILHLEPYEFNEPGHDVTIQNLKYYYGSNPFVTGAMNRLSRYEQWKFSLDLYRHNGRIVSLLKNFYQTTTSFQNSNGYDQILQTPRDSINTVYSFEKLDKKPKEKINRELLYQLEEFLEVAKRNNARVIAFTSPIYKGLSLYPETTRTLDSLLRSKNVQYLNLSKGIPDLTEKPALWKDAYHVNHAGAQVLSKILSDTLELSESK